MITKSRFHTLPTKKIQQILNEPYLRGNDGEGNDYHRYEDELKQILWARQAKQYEKEMIMSNKVKSRYEALLEENQELKDELRCLELELENETLKKRIQEMRDTRFPDIITNDDLF